LCAFEAAAELDVREEQVEHAQPGEVRDLLDHELVGAGGAVLYTERCETV
jgi:hypothetical protein